MKDAKTYSPLDVGVELRRASNPNLYIGSTLRANQILVPSLTEVLVEVFAKSYEPWPSKAEAAKTGRVYLKPREILDLDLKLQSSRLPLQKYRRLHGAKQSGVTRSCGSRIPQCRMA